MTSTASSMPGQQIASPASRRPPAAWRTQHRTGRATRAQHLPALHLPGRRGGHGQPEQGVALCLTGAQPGADEGHRRRTRPASMGVDPAWRWLLPTRNPASTSAPCPRPTRSAPCRSSRPPANGPPTWWAASSTCSIPTTTPRPASPSSGSCPHAAKDVDTAIAGLLPGPVLGEPVRHVRGHQGLRGGHQGQPELVPLNRQSRQGRPARPPAGVARSGPFSFAATRIEGAGNVAHDPLVGIHVDDRYLVLSKVARGGMSTVYLATDLRLERDVALKVLHPHLADGHRSSWSGSSREAKDAARLSHPHVVRVHDQGGTARPPIWSWNTSRATRCGTSSTATAPLSPRQALD